MRWLLSVPLIVGITASAAGLTAGLAGCENEPPKTALGYTESAKRAYDAALVEFNAHNWIEAQAMMREVKRKYSYSRQARLAELRIADADYEQEKYSDAIREYKDFVHQHRSDEEDSAYARSRIAEATYKEIPESFLSPASEERDQASVIDSYKEMRAYLADYPTSKESGHMRELLGDVVARLIRHELYVARFYLNKENYDATIARIQYALHTYAPGTPATGESAPLSAGAELSGQALLLLGETYLRMHKWPDARDAFQAAVRANPRSATAVLARNYLDSMKERGV
jgi:outer membrane protein assembly factor BamD